ncbi:hypothetical protein ERO13_D10G134550v2 [Gossypium hirsutum]|nr:hypothetical protein ERO13_D10G134550v2 [Gossypium hirsutum]
MEGLQNLVIPSMMMPVNNIYAYPCQNPMQFFNMETTTDSYIISIFY